MPLVKTRGAASAQGFGEFAQVTAANYIEDMFSCFLYDGTGSAQTITNGINLSGKGGLVWTKVRNNADSHWLGDTARGVGYVLESQSTNESRALSSYTSFNSNGYSIAQAATDLSGSGRTYVSWTFRKQPKFFDVVTYTGNTSGGSSQTIAHNLGSVPGCIIVKATSISGEYWAVWHRSFTTNQVIYLNRTDAVATTGAGNSFPTLPTATNFTVGFNGSQNGNGTQYVAYIFAHDAGGFGLTGTDNVISCGSVVGASQVEVNLGYEPQWILVKNASAAQDWWVVDNMRGLPVQATDTSYNASALRPNLSDAETTGFSIAPSATGFKANVLTSGQTYIYIAIRRGPMKVPTDGTKVFSPNLAAAQGQLTTGFPVDLGMWNYRTGYAENTVVNDRLRGVSSTNSVTNLNNLVTATNGAELASQGTQNWNNTGLYAVSGGAVFYSFRRAPSFFDEVCYTGTGSAQNLAHNLAVVPELMIVKRRTSGTGDFWFVYSASTGNTIYLSLNTTSAVEIFSGIWNDTTPTSTQFTIGYYISQSAAPYVAYLFATCAGVSKVGSYTGTAATLQIDCGFTGGARWVMIKRTNSTGDWYVWDTARGIVSGNDPYLLLNSTAAEVTNTDYIDTYSAGFEISSTAPAAINANGGTFIFLAIA